MTTVPKQSVRRLIDSVLDTIANKEKVIAALVQQADRLAEGGNGPKSVALQQTAHRMQAAVEELKQDMHGRKAELERV